jgi:5-methyltetrahydropteroyltriglutamate--homocysteine methyltransferase
MFARIFLKAQSEKGKNDVEVNIMALSTLLGFPRIGRARELKTALEKFWKDDLTPAAFRAAARDVEEANWHLEKALGIDMLPVGDFSTYDHVLDTAVLCGAVPERYGKTVGLIDDATYFAMARGAQKNGLDVPALEMTKWFDTNYHYIVPSFAPDQTFRSASEKPFDALKRARAMGIEARPVLLGPVSFLLLGKNVNEGSPLTHLDRLLPVYAETVRRLAEEGAVWIQLDEPMLVADLAPDAAAAYEKAYRALRDATSAKLFVTTPFGALGPNRGLALNLPIDALHLDLVRAPTQLDDVLAEAPSHLTLALGLVNGRNVWRNDLESSLNKVERAADKIGAMRLWVTPSCSLMHVPYDLALEETLDPEIKNWMAFAVQKVEETVLLTKGLNEGRASIADALAENRARLETRARSPRLEVSAVRERLIEQPLDNAGRTSPYAARRDKQRARLGLPRFPTTTIGSFPQTHAVRAHRAAFKSGKIDLAAYNAFLGEEMKKALEQQLEVGLDVLVHGEFERNDMVEYFGEQLAGFLFTKHGWVQSYGSRCVKPPVIYGDVWRPAPMTLDWIVAAQGMTHKPVKGMLTGPVTILQWSFVRDDLPRGMVAHQIALALQDEVLDLEKAGIKIIQIDEPAFREGLPLRRNAWDAYFDWAIKAFKLVSTGVDDATQIHTHMCYSDFNAIIDAIAAMDADVISIETSRSNMELLEIFKEKGYPNEIGPGVYDIHSPRVPSQAEIEGLLMKACERLAPDQIWVNPDCGLKTRDWPETIASLHVMVMAAHAMRKRFP